MTRTLLSAEARINLADLSDLGAGNFAHYAVRAQPYPDEPLLWLENPYQSLAGESFTKLSLNELLDAAREIAAWYHGQGVKPKDPVGVYFDDGVEYLVHYVALTGLGAIPVLTNGAMPPAVAAAYFSRIGVVGVFTDESRRAALGEGQPTGKQGGFLVTADDLRGQALPQLPASYPFVHAANDPIMIAHSSGTTGAPKAVLLQHKAFLHGVRYRLAVPPVPGGERILSSLPHSHNCAIAYIMLAILAGTPVFVASNHEGPAVLDQIEAFRPTMVVSFPQTYVEICERDLTCYDLSSVRLWFNGGDAAHEAHVRKLVRSARGSRFVDGMGSSEMGFSLFRHVHDESSEIFGRCVGTPLEWVEAAALGDDGRQLPPGEVGRLGVRAPSVTTGYWNDSLLTHRTQLSGFWLTGDLVYRDDAGRFFHVDRVPDVVTTRSGPLYSLQTEEFLLSRFSDIIDVSVIAAPLSDGAQGAIALVRLATDETTPALDLLERYNTALVADGLLPLAAVEVTSADHIPLGATGKVLKRELRDRYRGHFGGLS